MTQFSNGIGDTFISSLGFQRHIWELMGRYDAAVIGRSFKIGRSGGDTSGYLAQRELHPRPTNEAEDAIWDELTAPHNYDALCRHINRGTPKNERNDYANNLFEALLEDASRRAAKK